MHINEIFASEGVPISFELFPAKTQKGERLLHETIKDLDTLEPAFISVTYGAGGGTRKKTLALVSHLLEETDTPVVSHLTCVDTTVEQTGYIVDGLVEAGTSNIMALRGDPPKGVRTFSPHAGGFTYAAELVRFLRERHPTLGIGVAGFVEGHPATPNRLEELDHLKAKVDAGADYICTQLFFDNRDFYDFVERARRVGIDVPIVAGVLPITSAKSMRRMAGLAAGARFPAPLLKKIDRAVPHGESAVAEEGVEWAVEQVSDLLENGVDGVHLYTLNKSGPTRQILNAVRGIRRLRNPRYV